MTQAANADETLKRWQDEEAAVAPESSAAVATRDQLAA